ncbi:MAG: hypothetical protein K0T99_04845 [Alphaproteobacteria bacterium]|nr:hypothetical protein [Alphaproteobacteria bacterium]
MSKNRDGAADAKPTFLFLLREGRINSLKAIISRSTSPNMQLLFAEPIVAGIKEWFEGLSNKPDHILTLHDLFESFSGESKIYFIKEFGLELLKDMSSAPASTVRALLKFGSEEVIKAVLENQGILNLLFDNTVLGFADLYVFEGCLSEIEFSKKLFKESVWFRLAILLAHFGDFETDVSALITSDYQVTAKDLKLVLDNNIGHSILLAMLKNSDPTTIEEFISSLTQEEVNALLLIDGVQDCLEHNKITISSPSEDEDKNGKKIPAAAAADEEESGDEWHSCGEEDDQEEADAAPAAAAGQSEAAAVVAAEVSTLDPNPVNATGIVQVGGAEGQNQGGAGGNPGDDGPGAGAIEAGESVLVAALVGANEITE